MSGVRLCLGVVGYLKLTATVLASAACVTVPSATNSPAAVGIAQATMPVPARIVVSADAASVTLKVGEVLLVKPPSAADWLVTGGDGLLEPVAHGGEGRPGPDGWRFVAKTAGEGELLFAGHAATPCPDPPRCPPGMPLPSITLRVVVTP